jgi:hypothetical protein
VIPPQRYPGDVEVLQPPKRSITRFFIPLIDVLILLFGIFLLMPFVSRPDPGVPDPTADPDSPAAKSADDLRQKVLELELKLEKATQELARMQRDATNPANRMSVRVLEIDAGSGKLYYFDADNPTEPRQEVREQADAQRLIDQQRRLARGKDVFFLILYPRKLTGYPLQEQVDTYRRWLKDVPHGFDNPWVTDASVK